MNSLSSVLVALLLIPVSVAAQPSISDKLIRQFSSCDARFFRAIKQYASSLKGTGPLTFKGDIAFWKVPDRNVEEKSVILFSTPIIGKLTLIGYSDDIFDLKSSGMYYTWGFLAKGSLESIAEAIRPLIEDGARLRKEGDAYARSEIRYLADVDGKWQMDDTLASGTVPKAGTVERVLVLDDVNDTYPGVTRISCSLQGSVTPSLLATERPDIKFKK